MKRLMKWFAERQTQEKWMLALIAILLVGVIVRWAWVSDEIAGAWRDRFSAPESVSTPAPVPDPAPAPDGQP